MANDSRPGLQEGSPQELRRLAVRALLQIEDYSKMLGEVEVVLRLPNEAGAWIVILFRNTIEIAELNGAQNRGVMFEKRGSMITIRQRVPLDAICNTLPVEVFILPACAIKRGEKCDWRQALWFRRSIGLPFLSRSRWDKSHEP